MRRYFLLAAIAAFAVAIGGCASVVVFPEVKTLSDLNDNTVLLVGRIELVPALRPDEQQIETATLDPFGGREAVLNRILLYLGDQPVAADQNWSVLNPRLGETFFVRIPKDKPFVVAGRVYMQFKSQTARSPHELRLPVPIALGVKQDDRVVYVGTWRITRDVFHSVIDFAVLDQLSQASVDARQRFGETVLMRKSLAKIVATRGT